MVFHCHRISVAPTSISIPVPNTVIKYHIIPNSCFYKHAIILKRLQLGLSTMSHNELKHEKKIPISNVRLGGCTNYLKD